MNRIVALLVCLPTLLCGTISAAGELVRFPGSWTSPYRVDPDRPFQLVNAEGRHLFPVNKTAWLYFGCEGIDEVDYKAPGAEFLRPMADCFRALPFWELHPNYTAMTIDQPDLVWATLAHSDRSTVILYVCARGTGQRATRVSALARLPDGNYRITFQSPADMAILGTYDHIAGGLGQVARIPLPAFTDDLVVTTRKVQSFKPTRIPGTR